jgi:amino acid transporter
MRSSLSKAVQALRDLHRNEDGDVPSTVAIGAVGVLLAALILSVMSNSIQGSGGLKSMLSQLFGGGSGGLGSFL